MPNIASEINFWSDIMEDHAEFILMSLSSKETQFTAVAQKFKDVFNKIKSESKLLIEKPNTEEETKLKLKVMPIIVDFVNYKKILLKKLLENDIELHLSLTTVNDMISEATEFYRILNKPRLDDLPYSKITENIILHYLWIPDAAGHAGSIVSNLDPIESTLIKEAEEFKRLFNCLFIKLVGLEKMLNRTKSDDGYLKYFNKEAIDTMRDFVSYLEKIKDLRQNKMILGILNPIMADHMIKEENYYLMNLINLVK